MWDRAALKTEAKSFLRRHYWQSFIIALAISLVGGNDNLFLGGGQSRGGGSQGAGIRLNIGDHFFGSLGGIPGWWFEQIGIPMVIFLSLGMVVLVMVLFIGVRYLIGAPLEVGGRRFFVEGIDNEAHMANLLMVIKSKDYLNVVKTMFIRGLYTFFWTLLLIIPGIIKHYSYRMVPYILSDKPDLDTEMAIQRSIDMTRGQKWDMLILDLSFFGWYLLGAVFLGIGVLFVHPYYEATYAQLYKTLRTNMNNLSETLQSVSSDNGEMTET